MFSFMPTFIAEKVKVTGPKVDGGYSVTFEVGEYEQQHVANLLLLPRDTIIQVSVEVQDA